MSDLSAVALPDSPELPEGAGKSLARMLEIIGPWMPKREIGLPPKRSKWRLSGSSRGGGMTDGNTRELKLGKKLWDRIEGPQGFSFVSSDVVEWSDGRVLEFVQNALPDARKVVRILEAFDKKYHFRDHS